MQILRSVPALRDIRKMCEVLESVGCKVQGGVDGADTLLIDPSTVRVWYNGGRLMQQRRSMPVIKRLTLDRLMVSFRSVADHYSRAQSRCSRLSARKLFYYR